MSTVVRLDDHRPVDPVENEEIRRLLTEWYRFSIGGTPNYGPVILTPFMASEETDPLYSVRYVMPKVMLVIQPTVKAWALREKCTLDLVHAAVHHQPKLVVQEWLTACCEIGALHMHDDDGEACYTPSRQVVYRTLEIIMTLEDSLQQLRQEVAEGFEALHDGNSWVGIETPLPE